MNLADLYDPKPNLLEQIQNPSVLAYLSLFVALPAVVVIAIMALSKGEGQTKPAFATGAIGGLAIGAPAFSWIAGLFVLVTLLATVILATTAAGEATRGAKVKNARAAAAGGAGLLLGYAVATAVRMMVTGD